MNIPKTEKEREEAIKTHVSFMDKEGLQDFVIQSLREMSEEELRDFVIRLFKAMSLEKFNFELGLNDDEEDIEGYVIVMGAWLLK